MIDEARQTPSKTVSHGQTIDEAAADNFGLTAADLDESDNECPNCGGEGWTFECFDGCCADADTGCDDCLRECSCQKRPASPELQEVLREALADAEQLTSSHREAGRITSDLPVFAPTIASLLGDSSEQSVRASRGTNNEQSEDRNLAGADCGSGGHHLEADREAAVSVHEPLAVDHRPAVTPDNFEQVVTDALNAMGIEDPKPATSTQEDDSF